MLLFFLVLSSSSFFVIITEYYFLIFLLRWKPIMRMPLGLARIVLRIEKRVERNLDQRVDSQLTHCIYVIFAMTKASIDTYYTQLQKSIKQDHFWFILLMLLLMRTL